MLLRVLVKNEPVDFSPLTYNGEVKKLSWKKICIDLRSSIQKIRDKQVVGSCGLVTSCKFQSVRSSTLALMRFQNCKKVMWGRVTQADLMTWPFKIGSYNFNIIYKKDQGIGMPNFAALRAVVCPLSTKNLRGRISAPPPSVRGLRCVHIIMV